MPAMPAHRVNILGVGIHATDMRRTLDVLEETIARGRKGYVCATGVHGIMEAQRDPALKSILNRALVNAPDGRPTVWLGRVRGFAHMRQVYGPTLMLELCARSVERGYTHFIYGGKPGVVEELRTALTRKFPGLRIVGTYAPPFRPLLPSEEAQLLTMVAELKPDIFWVGLGTPKQERFMAEYLPRLDTRVMLGVGAAFDIHTGRLQDAPEWVRSAGLQWFHRLYQEPARLWRRYLVNNPKFLVKIAAQLLHIRKYEIA
jgi:N-acetylglucosaminyldiphosphoundecaprenol N-acetyl-beta-D-mannosaminyltransferase